MTTAPPQDPIQTWLSAAITAAATRASAELARRNLRTIETLCLLVAHQSGEVAKSTRTLQVNGQGLEPIWEAAATLASLSLQLCLSVRRELAAAEEEEWKGGIKCADD